MDLVMALTSISKYSGDRFAYRRVVVDNDGVITPDEANWHNGTYRISDEIGFDRKSESVFSASGKLLTTEEGETTSEIIITSAQTDANLIQFIKNEARDQYFEVFFDAGKGNEKKFLEVFAPLVQFRGLLSIKSGTRKPDVTIDVLSNLTAVTPTTLPSWAKGDVGDFVTGVDELFTPFETA